MNEIMVYDYDNKINHKDLFCIASGNDGSWRLIYKCHYQWKDKITIAILDLLGE